MLRHSNSSTLQLSEASTFNACIGRLLHPKTSISKDFHIGRLPIGRPFTLEFLSTERLPHWTIAHRMCFHIEIYPYLTPFTYRGILILKPKCKRSYITFGALGFYNHSAVIQDSRHIPILSAGAHTVSYDCTLHHVWHVLQIGPITSCIALISTNN